MCLLPHAALVCCATLEATKHVKKKKNITKTTRRRRKAGTQCTNRWRERERQAQTNFHSSFFLSFFLSFLPFVYTFFLKKEYSSFTTCKKKLTVFFHNKGGCVTF